MDLVSIQPRRHTFSTRRTINPHALFSFTTGWSCPHSCLGGEQSTCRCALDDLDHAFATRCVFVVSKRRPNRSAPSWFRASRLRRRIFATYSNRRPRTGRIPAARVRRRTSALSSARQNRSTCVSRSSSSSPRVVLGWILRRVRIAHRRQLRHGTSPVHVLVVLLALGSHHALGDRHVAARPRRRVFEPHDAHTLFHTHTRSRSDTPSLTAPRRTKDSIRYTSFRSDTPPPLLPERLQGRPSHGGGKGCEPEATSD